MLKIILCFFLSTSALANDWVKFHEEDGIELYRSEKNSEGIIPFKAIATLDIPWQEVMMVLLDYEKKNEWSPKLKEVAMHRELSKNQFVFSEYYKTPWPATDREFLLDGTVERLGNGHFVLKATSSEEVKFADNDYIQCDVSYLNFEIKAVGRKTYISFSFLGDMKGWMPIWLINIIQKKWPLRFIQGLKKQIAAGKVRKTKIAANLL